jgi:hypothetical protein
VLERQIEQRLVRKVKEAGGVALKWVAPSTAGVPDRIVFLPGGRVMFVELKRPGGKRSAIQVHMCKLLEQLGADVRVVDTPEGVDAILT